MLTRKGGEIIGAYPYRAIIQDSIHGSIAINEGEYMLLQTGYMWRLHNIKHLGLNHLVFPTATHSRLSHSIGVMSISARIAERVVASARKSSRVCSALFTACNDYSYSYFIQAARITGLLHDIGHLPLSHTLEEPMRSTISHIGGSGSDRSLKSFLDHGDIEKLHEAYTAIFLEDLSRESRSFRLDNLDSLLLIASAVINRVSPESGKVQDMLSELGLNPGSLYVLRDIIASKPVDADRLDYLRRDAWFTGVVYGYTDLDRMIGGMGVDVGEGGVPGIVIAPKSIPSLEDILDARYKMYKSVYLHHKSVALSVALKRILKHMVEEWDEISEGVYPDEVSSFKDLVDPWRLSRAISEGLYYLDDVEFDILVRNMSRKGSKTAVRWAKSLTGERRLLPISLIKRPEEVLDRAVRATGIRGESLRDTGRIGEIIEGILTSEEELSSLIDSSVNRELKSLGVDPGSVAIEARVLRIGDKLEYKPLGSSLYLRFLQFVSAQPLTLAYIYSDEEEAHIRCWKGREEIRRAFIEALVERTTEVYSTG